MVALRSFPWPSTLESVFCTVGHTECNAFFDCGFTPYVVALDIMAEHLRIRCPTRLESDSPIWVCVCIVLFVGFLGDCAMSISHNPCRFPVFTFVLHRAPSVHAQSLVDPFHSLSAVASEHAMPAVAFNAFALKVVRGSTNFVSNLSWTLVRPCICHGSRQQALSITVSFSCASKTAAMAIANTPEHNTIRYSLL